MLFYILILIPIFTMGVSAFFASLYEYIKGDFSLILLIFSSLSIVITSFFLPRLIFIFYKPNTKKQLNVANKINILSCYVFYVILFFLSLTFCYKNFLTIKEVLPLYLSVFLVLFSSYFIYVYFIFRKIETFQVEDIKKINKNAFLLKLTNDNYNNIRYYVDGNHKYEIGKKYKFKFNKNSKIIFKEV